ncbi:ABC transporter ATP-binding protein [Streptomyces hygroscopicus subsp. sporocinereus]|uniref:ABC transporter ATP-binding protein n=1 Tax=Streptomyces hygroscopicus TaxID=1912 RepID=A0ABQ3U585_STRHY|nr:ABC transporter ATP-binding protein [Streptomyces hygroscopicus]GHJ30774.1 ABC transporter ATP-binding protein [Streptomyces hygroscopicus]
MSPAGSRTAGRYLQQRLRADRRTLIRVLVWTGVESLPAFVAGRAVALAVDRGFLAGEPLVGGGWLALLAVVSAVGAFGARGALLSTAAVVEPLRDALMTRTVEATLRHALTGGRVEQDRSGVARLTRQVEIVREAAGSMLSVVCRFAFSFVGVCVGTLTLEPTAALLVFAPVTVGVGCYVASLRGVVRAQMRSTLATESLAHEAWRLSAGLRDITAYGLEEPALRRLDDVAKETARAETALARLTALRTLALGVGGWVPLVLVLLWVRWGAQGMSAGTVLGVLTYIAQNLRPAVQNLVQGVGSTGIRLFVTLGRLLDDLGTRPGGAGSTPAPAVAASASSTRVGERAAGVEIVLESVSFSYPGGANDVLSGIDLRVAPGEHIAVVGPSGIGKSTLASLLAGTHRPTRGRVLLDGVDVTSLAPARQAALRAYLPQEAYVFTGTLRENLGYLADGRADDRRMDRAVTEFGLADLVSMTGGYGGVVDPDALSAGQRQLIALARAYLSPARLIVLDEATCHMDPAAEARAEGAMRERRGTLVVIAHRISSARAADRVMVLDGGAPRTGSHDRMLAESDLYRDLVGLWSAKSATP